MWRVILLLALIDFSTRSAQTQTTGTRTANVYVLGGQSNMQGLGKIVEIPTATARTIPHTYFWNGAAFEPLVLGQTKISARLAEFGPEVGLALELATADCPVYLIKYYASGMPLHHGWNGNDWIGGEPASGRRNFYPGEDSQDDRLGTLYQAMRSQFQAGIQHLRQSGQQPVVRGFVWMQGEQDSKHAESASSYAASLQRLRRRLAEDLEVAGMLPLVFGQVLPHQPAMPRFTHREQIRQQMADCDSNSGKTASMPATRMVATEACPLLPDTVHYDTSGQLRLGAAFADMLKQIAQTDCR